MCLLKPQMRAPTLVCALASSVVLASGVASAQEPQPAPGSTSTWFEPTPPEKKPSDAKPAPDTAPADATAPAEAPKVEADKKAPEPAVEVAKPRPAKVVTVEKPSSELVWRPEMSRPKTNVVLGGGMGLVSGRFSHPDLIGNGFTGVAANVYAGVLLNRMVLLGIDFDAYRSSLEHLGSGKYGYKGADNPRVVPANADNGQPRLTAGCQGCAPALGGGTVASGPLNVLTVGPRLQFAPDPARGLYAAVTGGVTFLEGTLENRGAFALGARGGYRIGFSDQVGLALEAGTSAHRFSNSTSVFGFGSLQLQMRL
jgi:hypothetical protein